MSNSRDLFKLISFAEPDNSEVLLTSSLASKDPSNVAPRRCCKGADASSRHLRRPIGLVVSSAAASREGQIASSKKAALPAVLTKFPALPAVFLLLGNAVLTRDGASLDDSDLRGVVYCRLGNPPASLNSLRSSIQSSLAKTPSILLCRDRV